MERRGYIPTEAKTDCYTQTSTLNMLCFPSSAFITTGEEQSLQIRNVHMAEVDGSSSEVKVTNSTLSLAETFPFCFTLDKLSAKA